MEKVYGIIYKTTCLVNGKIYIGQTVRLNYKSYLGSGILISAAIKKYGKENFIREILKECYNQTELDEWEDLLIWEYKSQDKNIGYNIAKGSVLGAIGEMSPSKLPEVRTKIAAAMKGVNNHNYGKTTSEETKAKLSAANKGKTLSDDTRKKISSAAKCRMRSGLPEGIRAKIAAAMTGKTLSDETRSKISIPILQYDKQGNFIAEYYGAREAARQTGVAHQNISACCKGKLKSAGWYQWRYKQ